MKAKYFPKKPSKGGTPIIAKRRIVRHAARYGEVSESIRRSVINHERYDGDVWKCAEESFDDEFAEKNGESGKLSSERRIAKAPRLVAT